MAAVRKVYVTSSLTVITDDLNEIFSGERASDVSARDHLPMFRKYQQTQMCDGWAMQVPEVVTRYNTTDKPRTTKYGN
jgi:hypothetical protein